MYSKYIIFYLTWNIVILQDLHDYGDSDGIKYAAKLQHPLGITWHSKDNAIYITDTYNHKIKKIDVTTQYCKTIYGDGKPNEKFSVCYI